jgi:hypothetical protein
MHAKTLQLSDEDLMIDLILNRSPIEAFESILVTCLEQNIKADVFVYLW